MSNVTNIAPSISDWPVDAIPENWIESLFEKMLFAYGAKFSDQWKGIDPKGLKRHWAHRLGVLTREELKAGVEKLEERDWPPTLPEFLRLCKPPVDPLVAYYAAVAGLTSRDKGEIGEWPHPAIFWAASRMSYDLKMQTYSQVKQRWDKALEDEMNKGQWGDIPQPSLSLPAPGKADLSREKAAQMIEQIGASEVLKPKTDHKLWAKRIIEREKRGDKSLTALQVRFATEAMAA